MRVALLTLLVAVVLFADGAGASRQLLLGGATALVLFLYARGSSVPRYQLTIAVLVATAGEITLSIVWGLYHYRFALLPLYVPFGHGLFYLIAAETAQQRWAVVRADAIRRAVLLGGSALAIAGLVLMKDQWGMLWWILTAVLIARSKHSLLLSICTVLTTALEWAGTSIGNWSWVAVVPHVGLTAGNPPSGVGVLYVLLDVMTVALAAAFVAPASAGGHRLLPPAEAGATKVSPA